MRHGHGYGLITALSAIAALFSCAGSMALGQTPSAPIFGVTAIRPWYNSCFIDFAVPSGAADVRWVPLNAQGDPLRECKYAALSYQTSPATVVGEIQVQGITPGQSVTGVLQAVNCVGPTPPANLMDEADGWPLPSSDMSGMMMTGSDQGMTPDGMLSTNGQGLWSNRPSVIEQSAPITLTCLPGPPPKLSGATQYWATEFSAPTAFAAPIDTPPAADNAWLGLRSITALQANRVSYTVLEQGLDTFPTHTRVFQMDRHLMWIAMDGGTFGTNNPLHMAHGYIGIEPAPTFHVAPDECLRVEWSVDSVNIDGRKAVEFLIQPATQWISNFSGLDQGPGEIMNPANQVLAVRAGIGNYQVTVGEGWTAPPPTAPAGTPVTPSYYSLDGSLGQAWQSPWRDHGANGKGRDDESDIVMYLSAAGIVVTEDGATEVSNTWNGHVPAWLTAPGGVRIEAASICYHTALCQADEQHWQTQDLPEWNDLYGAVYSDERHMNLLDVQVLPQSAMPAIQAVN